MNDGYLFVPLPEKVTRKRREAAVHDRRVAGALSGVIDVVFRTEQPVHVGSGFKSIHGDDVVRRGMKVQGRPGVPGASIKGVLRSRYEAITQSCAGEPPRGGSARSQSHPEVRSASFAQEVRRMRVFVACDPPELCPACALFGRMSQRSRVAVTDFVVENGCDFEIGSIPEQFSPNAHHLGEFRMASSASGHPKFEVLSLRGRKFAVSPGPVAENARMQRVEAIPAGRLLRGSLRIFNLKPEEIGGLLTALGRIPKSVLKIGGGKAHRFGRIALAELAFHLRGNTGAPASPDEAAWRSAFEHAQDDRWDAGERELVRIHQGDC